MSLDSKKLNTRFDLVVLSKIDKDGNISLLYNKPLSLEIYNQIPDSVISFCDEKRNVLFKYTISNYLAIKDYHNILFHGYRLQFQMAGETNWEINSKMVIRREYFSKIMQGIPYHHTDPYPINHDTPPPAAKTQHENVAVHADLSLAINAQAVNVVEQDPPIVTNAINTPPLEPAWSS